MHKTIENPEQFRNNFRNKLNEIIDDEKKSTNLEIGIFNYSLKESNQRKVIKKWDNPHFVQLYVDRCRSIYINLNNPLLLNQIKDGTLTVKNYAYMTHQEMKPEKWEVLIQEKMEREKSKYSNNIEAATDTYTCRKCKSNKCTYYQMQTRSADEPMTTFVGCIDCGNRWKC